MARPDTWMPFYWGDFWRDTGHLSPAEGWAYINLIGAYWVQGKPLDADEGRLQRLAKVTSLSEWERVRRVVLAFFMRTVIDGNDCYSHSRIDRELAAATKAYKSRVDHMAKVNAKRRKQQSLSPETATDTATVTVAASQSLFTVTDTQPQPQSPNGEGDANASPTAGRAKRPKGIRLETDWEPSAEDRAYAREHGLNDNETDAEAGEFRDYFTGADAREPVKRDWPAAWKRWVRGNAPRRIARRPKAGQSGAYRQGPGSVFAALSANLEAGGLDGQDHAGGGVGRGTDEDRMGRAAERGGPEDGPGAGGPVVDADDWRRVPEDVGAAEDSDQGSQRNDGGHPSVAEDLRGGTGEVSGGCGPRGAEYAPERQPVVASMGGTAGAVGGSDTQARRSQRSFESADDLEIPAFLDMRPGADARRAEARAKLVA